MSRPSGKAGRRCPICGRPQEETLKPFCSKRCADIDLSRWLGGGYAIPGEETDGTKPGSKPTEDGEGEDDESL